MIQYNVFQRALPILAATAVLVSAAGSLVAQAPGDLLVAPTRVVLTDRQRTGELILMNAGNTTATYRITFTHLRMSETGGMEQISAPSTDERFCDDLVRFSPRQITLEPRTSQTVRLQLRLPAELAVGEYRSHLLFKAIPDAAPAPEARGPDAKNAGDLSVHLIATFGVSIPVIVRHGHTSATATLTNLSVAADPAQSNAMVLAATINRTGDQSIYGDLVATFSRGTGRAVTVAKIGGVAVYTPNARRQIKLVLNPPKGTQIRSAKITLAYKEKPGDGGKTLAEASVDVP